MTTAKPGSMNEYIAGFPETVQKLLELMRATIKKAAPDATEAIKYAMPTFVFHGNLVHFAAFKNHIGFYAIPSGHIAFKEAFSVYKAGKGSVQFPYDKPLPVALITKVVKFRVKENLESAAVKQIKKKAKLTKPD